MMPETPQRKRKGLLRDDDYARSENMEWRKKKILTQHSSLGLIGHHNHQARMFVQFAAVTGLPRLKASDVASIIRMNPDGERSLVSFVEKAMEYFEKQYGSLPNCDFRQLQFSFLSQTLEDYVTARIVEIESERQDLIDRALIEFRNRSKSRSKKPIKKLEQLNSINVAAVTPKNEGSCAQAMSFAVVTQTSSDACDPTVEDAYEILKEFDLLDDLASEIVVPQASFAPIQEQAALPNTPLSHVFRWSPINESEEIFGNRFFGLSPITA